MWIMIAVCFEEAKEFFPEKKVVLTGNPRASEVLNQDGIERKIISWFKQSSTPLS